MIAKLKTFALTLTATAALLVPAFGVASVASADTISGHLCAGVTKLSVKNQSDDSCKNDTTAQDKVDDIVSYVINIFSIIVGIIAVIMIIVGGLKYITSGGDSNKVTSAKNSIVYAIIGLIIVALAQIIVKFVLAKATQS